MVVKQDGTHRLAFERLRVVLSHMVVKRLYIPLRRHSCLRVVLSHMVVKLNKQELIHLQCLRVVLSHMVVKHVVLMVNIIIGLRVVLSHMVVKRNLYSREENKTFESSVISYGSQTSAEL